MYSRRRLFSLEGRGHEHGYLDETAIEAVRAAGGLRAVTASHPHFYGSIAEWSRAFDAEVLVPEADAGWLTHPPERPPVTWSGSLQVLPGVTLVQCGGHFAGSAVVHWAGGAGADNSSASRPQRLGVGH